jgi:hypothetical protein
MRITATAKSPQIIRVLPADFQSLVSMGNFVLLFSFSFGGQHRTVNILSRFSLIHKAYSGWALQKKYYYVDRKRGCPFWWFSGIDIGPSSPLPRIAQALNVLLHE